MAVWIHSKPYPILTATYAPGDSTEDLVDYAAKAAAEVARLFPDAATYGRGHAAAKMHTH